MANKILGVKRINYNSKKDGHEVNGAELYYTYSAFGVEGDAADKAYISERVCDESGYDLDHLKDFIGSEIKLYFNRFKSVEGFKILGE